MDGDTIILLEAERMLDEIARLRNARHPAKLNFLAELLAQAGEIIDRLLIEIEVDRVEFEEVCGMLQGQLDRTTKANKRLAGMVAGIECGQVGRA